jgi:nucleoid-associated protein YgaU
MRTYTVSQGDTLQKISRKVYGSPEYASRIYRANLTAISDPNQLNVLQILHIPELSVTDAAEHVKREIFNA